MEWTTIVAMLALIEVIVFAMRVGMARGKYDVKAPATRGHEMFERHYRVHYNTIEQLILFLPGIVAFGYYVNDAWAAAIGVVFLIGRVVYAVTYVKNPASRGPGVLASMIPCWVLVIGGLVGAIVQLV